MRVEEAIGRQVARLRAQRQLSLADLGEALGRYLGKPWSRQAVHQAERGQRSFTAAELTALALALDTVARSGSTAAPAGKAPGSFCGCRDGRFGAGGMVAGQGPGREGTRRNKPVRPHQRTASGQSGAGAVR